MQGGGGVAGQVGFRETTPRHSMDTAAQHQLVMGMPMHHATSVTDASMRTYPAIDTPMHSHPSHHMPQASFTRPSFDPLVDILTQINRTFAVDDRVSSFAPPALKRQRTSGSGIDQPVHPLSSHPSLHSVPWSTAADAPPMFARMVGGIRGGLDGDSRLVSGVDGHVIREWLPLTDPSRFVNPMTLDPPGFQGGEETRRESPDGFEEGEELGVADEVQGMILNTFWESKADTIIEVVHRPSFVRKLASRLPVLRYAVCAYAAHHSFPKAPYHVVRKYYVKARDIAKASIKKPSFQTLQALTLLRALSMAMSDNAHGFFFLEEALKMSTELGLRVTWTDGRIEVDSTQEIEDDVDVDEMKKCWMACYFHDRMGAIASGQAHFLPVIGGVHDVTVLEANLSVQASLDTPTPTTTATTNSNSTTTTPYVAINPSQPLFPVHQNPDPLDHLMKLLDIAFVIHRAAKKPIVTEEELLERWETLEVAESRLSAWAFEVPVWMLSEPTADWCLHTFGSGKVEDVPWSALTVLFLYHSLRCFLHRPRLSLEAVLTDLAGGVGGLGFGGHTDAAIVRKLEALGIPGAVEVTAESAFIVARTTAKILQADPAMRDMNPPFAFCLTTVAIALGDLAKRRSTYLLAVGGLSGVGTERMFKGCMGRDSIMADAFAGSCETSEKPPSTESTSPPPPFSILLGNVRPGMSPGPEGLGECREGIEATLKILRNLLPYWNVMQFIILLEGVLANVRKWEGDVIERSGAVAKAIA
ncbi:hypothetical protein HDU67_006312 [Dinochytrium kinnereticum]|nr:hypothetical protein HDU67_006312 [Dinochytrium kinnereticum]